MVISNTNYQASQILESEGVDTTEVGFWDKHILVGGIQVTEPEQEIYIGTQESILIQIGDQTIKCLVNPETIQQA